MAIPSRQIGWSTKANLLWQISKQLEQLIKVSAPNKIRDLIALFKLRVGFNDGTFEAEACLNATLTNLDSLGLLDKASLIITPNAYNEGVLYDVVPNTPLGDMDVVRATTATRVNSLGLIEEVGLNVPRIDFSNGICPSLLVEPQRTNILNYSDDFTNSSWVKYNGAIVTPSVIPSLIQGKIAYDITNIGIAGGVLLQGIAPLTDKTYSVWIRAIDASDVGKTVGFANNGSFSVFITLTANWQKFTYFDLGTFGNQFQIGGGGTANKFCLCATQLEQGSYSTSYIPTTLSTVTRNADVISKTNSFIANKTAACLFIDLNRYYYASDYVGILGYRNGTTCDLYMLQYQNSDVIEFRAKSANGVQNSINLNVSLGHSKIAMYRENDKLSIFINGIKIIEQTSVSPMNEFLNSPQPLRINTDPFFGSYDAQLFINSAQIYTTILTDQECINLTTL